VPLHAKHNGVTPLGTPCKTQNISSQIIGHCAQDCKAYQCSHSMHMQSHTCRDTATRDMGQSQNIPLIRRPDERPANNQTHIRFCTTPESPGVASLSQAMRCVRTPRHTMGLALSQAMRRQAHAHMSMRGCTHAYIRTNIQFISMSSSTSFYNSAV
jgi:hypothetical protein